MEYKEIRDAVMEAAKVSAKRGPGYSQQRVVLNEVAKKFGNGRYPQLDIKLQQAILTCWYDLFREGHLSWGYDLDNPDVPFFHVPERDNGQS